MRGYTVNKKIIISSILIRIMAGLAILLSLTIMTAIRSLAAGSVYYTPEINVVFENAGSLDDGTDAAWFKLTPIDTASLTAETSRAGRRGTGEIQFSKIQYSAPGTYIYQIQQEDSGNSLMIYDTTPRRIQVFVYYDDRDELCLSANCVNMSTGEKCDLVFTNTRRSIPNAGIRSGGTAGSADPDILPYSSGSADGNTGNTSTGDADHLSVSSRTASAGAGIKDSQTVNDSGISAGSEKNRTRDMSVFLPKTGDSSITEIIMIIMLASILGIVIVLIFINRRKNGEQKE